MVLRNVPSTATFEEQRVEINELAADVNAISTDLVGDGSPQLGGDLDLNGNDITGTGNINHTGQLTTGSILSSAALNNKGSVQFGTVDAYSIGHMPANSNLAFSQTHGGSYLFYSDASTVELEIASGGITVDGSGTFGGDVEIGGTSGNPNTKLYASGSAEFAGGVDLAATNVNGSSINTLGGFTVQGSNGLRIVLDGYNQTTNTVRILTDGSATFASNIRSDGQIRSDRFKCGNNADQDKILLNNDGSANFAGAVVHGQLTAGGTGGNYFSNGEVAAYGPTSSGNIWRGWDVSGSSNVLTSSITAAGSAMFANDITLDRATAPSDVKISGSDTHAVWLSDGKFAIKYDGSAQFGESGGNFVSIDTNGKLLARNSSSSATVVLAANFNGTDNFTVAANGTIASNSGLVAANVNLQSSTTASWFQTGTSLGGSDYVWAVKNSSTNTWHGGLKTSSDLYLGGDITSDPKILLNGSNGSASFDETVTIGSGSAAPDDYGLIAYANANTLSNKSAVYARNLADGRNFTGDNSSGATTFEVYANGSATFAGSVDVGGSLNLNDTTVDLYSQTTNASSKTFQLFSDIGGTKVEKLSIQSNGNVVIGGNDINSSLNGIKMYVSGSDPSLIAAKADNNPGAAVTLLKLAGYSQSGSNYRENAAILFETDSANNAGNASGRILLRTEDNNSTNGPLTRVTINDNGKFTHAGGRLNNSGGDNLNDGQYNRITAGKSIGPNDNKTFTISGLQSGWMRITGGGYSSAGQSQFAIFYTMGGYMTATSTYDVAKHQEWGAGVSISTSKNAQSYDITLTNNSGSYTLACNFTVESSSANLKITSN